MIWGWCSLFTKIGLINTSEGKALMLKIASNFNQRRYSNSNITSPIKLVTQDEINQVLSLPPLWDLNSDLSHVKLVMKNLSFIRRK